MGNCWCHFLGIANTFLVCNFTLFSPSIYVHSCMYVWESARFTPPTAWTDIVDMFLFGLSLWQDKYLHNSSGYSKFKRNTEKRNKKYFIDNSKIGCQYWGRKLLTILMPFPPPNIRFCCACVLKHPMVLNISHYTGKLANSWFWFCHTYYLLLN